MTYPYLFIEGIPGSGKTTLADALMHRLPGYRLYREGDISPVELAWCSYLTIPEYEQALGAFPALDAEIRSHTVSEGDHRITAYTKIHTDDRSFYEYMERHEIYAGRRDIETFREIVLQRYSAFFAAECAAENRCIFECSLFQNIIEELMLFAQYDHTQIREFYRALFSCMDMEKVCLIRLKPANIGESIDQIRRERVNEQGQEIWYQMMIDYLNASPYGKSHTFSTFEDLLEHFEKRIRYEDKLTAELFKGRYIELPSKAFSLDALCEALADA